MELTNMNMKKALIIGGVVAVFIALGAVMFLSAKSDTEKLNKAVAEQEKVEEKEKKPVIGIEDEEIYPLKDLIDVDKLFYEYGEDTETGWIKKPNSWDVVWEYEAPNDKRIFYQDGTAYVFKKDLDKKKEGYDSITYKKVEIKLFLNDGEIE